MQRLTSLSHRLWFVLAVILFSLVALPVGVGAQDVGDPIRLERSISPDQVIQGQGEFQVTLSIFPGVSPACKQVVSGKPADIILVIDRSSSMDDAAGVPEFKTKLDAAKSAAKTFVQALDLKQNQIGLVQFNAGADAVLTLTGSRQDLERAIDSLDASDGTAIDQGILLALQQLRQHGRSDANRIVILLSDGDSSENAAMTAAKKARKQGVRLLTIGLGKDANQNLLQKMVVSADDAYFSPDAGQLKAIYQDIAVIVSQPLTLQDIIFDHTFDNAAFEVIPDSITPEDGQLAGGKISWTLKELPDAGQVFSYRARPLSTGAFNLDTGDQVRFTICQEASDTLSQPAGLPVQVALPPTSTPSPTPTLTPTPTATFTPLPTPLPTSTPTPKEIVTDTICKDSYPLWLFLLCLGFWGLLFLLSLWYLYKRLRAELDKPAEQRRCLCGLIPWLLLPLLVLFLASLMNHVLGAYCATRESVYFWRIGSSQTGIFYAPASGSGEAKSFQAINQSAGCIGCHSVSSQSRRIAAIAGGGDGEVVVYSLDGTPVDIPNIHGSYLSWSPDGTHLAISDSKADIYILDLQTNSLTPLEGASDPAVAEMMPSWGPDQRIAFVRSTSFSTGWRLDAPCDIYTIPEAGGTAEPFLGASSDGFNYYPVYSPDGRWLAFTRHTTGSTTYSDPAAEIYLVSAQGGEAVRIAANDASNGQAGQNFSNSWPTWSLDGNKLAFNSKRNDQDFDVFITDIQPDGQSGPAWPLAAAATSGIFEHLPFWGAPPPVNVWDWLLGLWPWLIPVLLILLAWLLCRLLCKKKVVVVPPPVVRRPRPRPLAPLNIEIPWTVKPALIIGVGGTGRWVLTHLKKSLLDGGLGKLPPGIHFVLLDTQEKEATSANQDVSFAGVHLDRDEMLLLQDDLADVILKLAKEVEPAKADPVLGGWFPAKSYRTLGAHTQLARGTFGRRPMSRGGLVVHLRGSESTSSQSQSQSQQLWQLLTQSCQKVAEAASGQVDVILIGSLGGGMSGILVDLAYLVRAARRHLTGSVGETRVEGFFAMPSAYQGGNSIGARVNMVETLRELARFQVPSSWPYHMQYHLDRQDLPDGDSEFLRLLDDVHLFGNAGTPETGANKSSAPWATVLASMADVTAFRLDQAAASGWTNVRNNIATQSINRTEQSNNLIVSSLGSYVYRFPLQDILNEVKTRWAYTLLTEYLKTEEAAPGGDSARESVRRFLQGELGCGQPPESAAALWRLADQSSLSSQESHQLEHIQFHESEKAFLAYLSRALDLFLNGVQGVRVNNLRAGRATLARDFVDELAGILSQAERRSMDLSDRADEKGRTIYRAAHELAQCWRKAVEGPVNVLKEQHQLLTREPAEGIQDRLHRLAIDAHNRRAQMDQVAVRKYLWNGVVDLNKPLDAPGNLTDLAEKWYLEYAHPHLVEYLERLYWEVSPSGEARLSLVTYDDDRPKLLLSTANADLFVQEILHMADFVVREVWENNVLFADMLKDHRIIGDNAPAEDVLARIWPVANPHLAAPTVGVERDSAAGVPPQVQRVAPELCNALKDPRSVLDAHFGPSGGTLLNFSDRYALALVRTVDLIPLSQIAEYQQAQMEYFSLLGRSTLDASELTAVFAAERNALEYERRLPNELHMPHRLFNPYIASAFEHLDRLKLYALAFAGGLILVEGNGNISVKANGQKVGLGKTSEAANLPGEVIGLLNFCYKSEKALVDDLDRELASPSRSVKKAWQEYLDQWNKAQGIPEQFMVKGTEQEKVKALLLQELAAVAALCVIDAVQA